RPGLAEPVPVILHAAFEIANAGEVLVELALIVDAEGALEPARFVAQGIEHAGAAEELRFALPERVLRIGPEELIEQDVGAILGGQRGTAGAPGKSLVVKTAEAGAALDAQ